MDILSSPATALLLTLFLVLFFSDSLDENKDWILKKQLVAYLAVYYECSCRCRFTIAPNCSSSPAQGTLRLLRSYGVRIAVT